ncbi:hypothetical protein [Lentzea sp. NBRC 105346]|uniref:hypothetical protein n=1 Tax=Lentzea sp. NBRC 105346 TaxID=3032205 RepID=UPI002553EA6B|nr:hypothetical protein [Lentzea sp. NBRC 105346]
MGVRVLVSAGVIALAYWLAVIAPGLVVLGFCDLEGWGCLGWYLLALPVAMVLMSVVAGVALRKIGVRPAWLVVVLSILLLAGWTALGWNGLVRFSLPLPLYLDRLLIGAIAGGLAAWATARYGDRRDREDASLRG